MPSEPFAAVRETHIGVVFLLGVSDVTEPVRDVAGPPSRSTISS